MPEEHGQARYQKPVDALIGLLAVGAISLAVFAPLYTSGAYGFDAMRIPDFLESVLWIITVGELGLVAIVVVWMLFEHAAALGRDVRSWWGEANE